MIYNSLPDVDFRKYDRLFTFGCSFTNWKYPTWADIISRNFDIPLQNYGAGGQGNLYISTLLNQVNLFHNLNQRDLVMIMWASMHRNDHYNIFPNQESHVQVLADSSIRDYNWRIESENWKSGCDLVSVEMTGHISYPDARGFMIRDCALMDYAIRMCEHADFDSVHMMAVAPHEQAEYDFSADGFPVQDVLDMYADQIMPNIAGDVSLCKFLEFDFHGRMTWLEDGELREDHHPLPSEHIGYLNTLGLTIDQHTCDWAERADQKVIHCDDGDPKIDGWRLASPQYPL